MLLLSSITNSPTITATIASKFFAFPQALRFFTSAALGNAVLFLLDKTIYRHLVGIKSTTLPGPIQENVETISFFVSYTLQIFAQHFLNAILVFGWSTISTREKYAKTLAGTYTTYFGSLVGTTFINTLLIKRGITKNMAFWISISSFGLFNYFLLSLMSENKKLLESKDKNPSTREVLMDSMNIHRGGAGARAKYIMETVPEIVVFGSAAERDMLRLVKKPSTKVIV